MKLQVFNVLLFSILSTVPLLASSAHGKSVAIVASPAAKKILIADTDPQSNKITSLFEVQGAANRAVRYIAFDVTLLEGGEEFDSNYALIREGTGEPALVVRDTSLFSLRSGSLIQIPEVDIKAILLEFGRFEMNRMGGAKAYRKYAQEMAAEGSANKDELWVFKQLLGKDFTK